MTYDRDSAATKEPVPAMSSSPVDISAIVVTFNTGRILRDCLQRLAMTTGVAEVIVVDNGNPAEDEAWIDDFANRNPRVRVLRGAGNVGFGAACNLGAAVAASPWLLFVNPDLVVEPEASDRLREFAAERSGLALVGGRLIGPDGREQRGSRREEITPWSAFVAGAGLGRLEWLSPIFRDPHRECDPVPEGPIEVAAVSGALFLMARSGFAQVGGFDPAYFLHLEDVDLCRRVRDAGGTVWFHPNAEGAHIGGTSGVAYSIVEGWKVRGFREYFRRYARGWGHYILGEAVVLALAARNRVAKMLRGRDSHRVEVTGFASPPNQGEMSQ